MNRRNFLKWIVVSGFSCLALLYIYKSGYWQLRQIIKGYKNPRLNTNSPTGRLKEEGLKDIIAVAEVLIPQDETPGADKNWVLGFVNNKTENEPGYLHEYQNAVNLLDKITEDLRGKPAKFYTLSFDERDMLLLQHFKMDGLFVQLQFFNKSGNLKSRTWHFVMKEIINKFYSSSHGWSTVGYTNYPGIPGDTFAYTRDLTP